MSFKEPRPRRWPLLIAILLFSALGLGFAAYMEQPESAGPAASVAPADDTAHPASERTSIEIRGLGNGLTAANRPPEALLQVAAADIPAVQGDGHRLSDTAATMLREDSPLAGEGLPLTGSNDRGRDEGLDWAEHEVVSGDSLSRIFSQLEISGQLQEILALGDQAPDLQQIYPGERMHAGTRDGQLEELIYEPRGGEHYLKVTRDPATGEYVAERQEHQLETQRRVVHAEIQHSLFIDGSRAGLSDATLIQIAEIFGWDIDFAWDTRDGDRMIVIYDRILKDGKHLRDGPVLAAEFHNRGRILQALRFAPEGEKADYYAPDGKSMRQAFLRTPVDVGRISSHFGPRKHPILGYTRQHQGVDYAAPTGTPIRAAGNGRIVHRGTRGGYGKTVIIDHGNNYRTLYAHLNSYRRGQSVGSRVSQGEIIGHIGMTGTATGPHLHYEFHVRGKPANPITVDIPRAESLPDAQMEAFRRETAPLLATIEVIRDTQLAEGATGADPR
ncbi:M23 family metallopeptidase [Thioalkalivibrio sp.]|uniref:M23 family metallopeptidase n=1 Tax=Thioalkalivibrio sp. TaxID=2093813 RepID=UPI00356AE17C